jgi:hypothetical protein
MLSPNPWLPQETRSSKERPMGPTECTHAGSRGFLCASFWYGPAGGPADVVVD